MTIRLAPSAGYLRVSLERIRSGEVTAMRALGGLLLLAAIFSVTQPVFLSPGNLANLITQSAGIAIIAMGLMCVLLLGEIDLSAGVTSGVGAAVLAKLLTLEHLTLAVALPAALLVGVVIGLFLGFVVAVIEVPAFVITLAAFLAFQGVVLLLIGDGGNVSITNEVILALENDNLSVWLGWALGTLTVSAYAASTLAGVRRKWRAAGETGEPTSLAAARVVLFTMVTLSVVYVLNLERSRAPHLVSLRGVPVVVVVIGVLFLALNFALSRTAFGRHVYAVGGNAEAARRAGVPVVRVRMTAFVVCSTMAVIGGVVMASRTNGVDPNAGGGNVLLYAVGAAVIGGTSLFGGHGCVRDALLGAASIAVIDNGMGLFNYSAGIKTVVTGVVLALAAGVDTVSRRRAQAVGLR